MLPLPRTIAEPETAATERGIEPGTSQKAPDDVKQTQQLPLDAPPIRVAGDVESEDEANTTPGPSVSADPAHNMTIAVYRAPSLFSSEDLSSSGGSSLTLPTVATLDALPIPRPMRPSEWPELSLYPEFDEEIRKTPFEVQIEPPSKLLIIDTTQQSPQHPSSHSFRPWKFEFWWQNGALHSSGGTLRSVLESSHRSRSGRFSGATAGSSNGISESSHASTVLMVAPPADVPLHIAVHDEDEVYWTTRQRRGELVEMLKYHFWRTHGPQGADGPNGETSPHCTNSFTPVSYTKAMPARSSARGRSSRRLLNGGGSGSGGDDDPHDGDDGRSRHLDGLVFKRTRHFACPFQKWRPRRFKDCLQRHRDVCDVKRHISKKHYIPRCPRCHTCWRTPVARMEHYHNNSCRERPISLQSLGYVSEQQLAIIRRRPGGRKSREQQWRDIFNIIFPDEPQPQDVYVDRRADDTMHRIAHQYGRCCRHSLLDHQAELARENPFLDQFESLEAQREAVAELYVPSLMLDFDGQGTAGWSPPFPLRIDSQIHNNHSQSQVHGVPLTLDSLGRAHRESTGPYDTPQSRPSVVPSLPFNWNIAPPLDAHILPDVTPAALGYEPMATNRVEQQPPMVPQPGQDFDLLLHHQPIEDILVAFDSQFANNNSNTLLQPAFHGNSLGLSMDASIPADSSFLPEIQGLAPVPVVAGGSLSAPTPADASFDYAVTSPLTTFVQPYIQWPDVASETQSLFNSSYVPYQGD